MKLFIDTLLVLLGEIGSLVNALSKGVLKVILCVCGGSNYRTRKCVYLGRDKVVTGIAFFYSQDTRLPEEIAEMFVGEDIDAQSGFGDI